jgi:alkylhydroperoxidase/carboxymuconolactone decarboxylase family protein YurZ
MSRADRTGRNMDQMLEQLRAWGYPPRKFQEVLARYAPAMLENWFGYLNRARELRTELDAKTYQFVIIGIQAAQGWPNLERHINKALDAGATIEEVVEVIMTAVELNGPRSFEGLSVLSDVIDKRQASGLGTARGSRSESRDRATSHKEEP